MCVKKFSLLFLIPLVFAQSVFDISTQSEIADELCDAQIKYIDESFSQGALWAKVIRDAWGNFPSGTFSGNFYDFGSFDQCIKFTHFPISLPPFKGQHCTIVFRHSLEVDVRGKFAPAPYDPNINIGIGICVPDSCSHERISEIANSTLIATRNTKLASYPPLRLMCSTSDNNFHWNYLRVLTMFFFVSIIFMLIFSTYYEISCNIKNTKKNEFFCAYSIYSNSKYIMTMKSFSSKEMLFLHGIRGLAIIWIIIGHAHILFWLMPVINNNDFFQWVQKAPTMFIFGAYMGVDTFFFLSAMLLTLSVFHELDKTNRISLLSLYLRRYIRITAPLIPLVLLAMTFYAYISDGPVWKLFMETMITKNCEERWWATLLYIGNLLTPGKYCLIHTWYLMIDMQLYLVSPLILYPIWRLRSKLKIAIPLILTIASISVIYVFIVSTKFDLQVSLLSENSNYREVLVYYMTLARIDSWMMGILTGFILYKMEGEIVKFSRKFVISGWIICVILILTVIYSQYPLQQEYFNENPQIADTSFEAFKRVAWCLAVGWIIIACQLGYGGIIKRFLSLSFWLPISKLSFCIYLVHIMIQFVYMSSIRTPEYFSSFKVFYKFFGDFGFSFIFAFILALMFEYPALRIVRAIKERK